MAFSLANLYNKPETSVAGPEGATNNLLDRVNSFQSGATTASGIKTVPTGSVYGDYLTGTQKTWTPVQEADRNTLVDNLLGQKQTNSYNSIVSAPTSISLQELLQKHPDAASWSPDVQQAFAQNYRLGLASIMDPSKAWEYSYGQDWLPVADANKGKVTYTSDGIKYNAIIDPSKIRWDPTYGLITDRDNRTAAKESSTGLIGGFADSLSESVLPTLALLAAVAGPALMGGQAAAGSTAGATTGGATGLSSLPAAGTWAQTATPALGAGAGSWTLPSALTGVSGATTAAGGLTLADALAAAPGSGTTTAGAVSAGSSSGLPNFDLPFQSPSSIQPIGESTGLGSVGSTAPDLGTGMITSPEGLSGLVNGQPIGTALGAATPGTTGGYLVPSLGGEALATTAAAGGLASSSSITDWLGNVFNQGVDKFMSDPLKNTLNLVGGISSYLGNNAQAKALEDYLKQGLSQSDPFGSQRAYYMNRLKSTYTNPEGYLKSPEYSAISKRRLEALERADAAQGRRSQYGARTEKMHEFDLENLNKERAMLAQLAGSGINPSQVSSLLSSLGTGSAQAQANAPGNLLFMLNQIFGGK